MRFFLQNYIILTNCNCIYTQLESNIFSRQGKNNSKFTGSIRLQAVFLCV